MRILIVEDEHISRELLRRSLEQFGVCDCVVNGREAIEAYHAAWDDKQPYELICLDIMMPELDGHAVLEHIRDDEQKKGICDETQAVKVIMTTCLDDPDNFARAFDRGSQWYVTKPIDRNHLMDVLEDLGLAGAAGGPRTT